MSLVLPSSTSLTQTTDRVEAKQATAFTPPKPPTASEEASADNKRKTWWLSAGAAILGGLLIYRAHVKAAMFCFAGAVGYPILQTFSDETSARTGLLICVVVGGALFWAWHLMNDKQTSTNETAIVK
jgi:protein-S-isoprenylcysteine O-methyltransferase Ste14